VVVGGERGVDHRDISMGKFSQHLASRRPHLH
jgi:hypothetical protein